MSKKNNPFKQVSKEEKAPSENAPKTPPTTTHPSAPSQVEIEKNNGAGPSTVCPSTRKRKFSCISATSEKTGDNSESLGGLSPFTAQDPEQDIIEEDSNIINNVSDNEFHDCVVSSCYITSHKYILLI